jgi:hypothetical protein
LTGAYLAYGLKLFSSLSGRVVVSIAIALLLIVLVLFITHGIWFDNPSEVIQRRMDIIGQLVVGIGTAALAVVTLASVYETQQVVSGEDLRFRQSRMPAVVLEDMPQSARAADGKPAFNVHFRNDGEGPAQDIEVSVEGTLHRAWQIRKVTMDVGRRVLDPPVPGGAVNGDIPSATLYGGSYLKPGDSGVAAMVLPELKAPDSTEHEIIGAFPLEWTIKGVTIKYKDVFGQQFTTAYRAQEERAFLKSFEVIRPTAYSRALIG